MHLLNRSSDSLQIFTRIDYDCCCFHPLLNKGALGKTDGCSKYTEEETLRCAGFLTQRGKRNHYSAVKHTLIQATVEQPSSEKQFPSKSALVKTVIHSFCHY